MNKFPKKSTIFGKKINLYLHHSEIQRKTSNGRLFAVFTGFNNQRQVPLQ